MQQRSIPSNIVPARPDIDFINAVITELNKYLKKHKKNLNEKYRKDHIIRVLGYIFSYLDYPQSTIEECFKGSEPSIKTIDPSKLKISPNAKKFNEFLNQLKLIGENRSLKTLIDAKIKKLDLNEITANLNTLESALEVKIKNATLANQAPLSLWFKLPADVLGLIGMRLDDRALCHLNRLAKNFKFTPNQTFWRNRTAKEYMLTVDAVVATAESKKKSYFDLYRQGIGTCYLYGNERGKTGLFQPVEYLNLRKNVILTDPLIFEDLDSLYNAVRSHAGYPYIFEINLPLALVKKSIEEKNFKRVFSFIKSVQVDQDAVLYFPRSRDALAGVTSIKIGYNNDSFIQRDAVKKSLVKLP